MAPHRSVDLELRKDKPDNVYRFIEEWEVVPSSHGTAGGIWYLLLYGIFQWGSARDIPVKAFSIAMQYAREPGRQVDVSQPPHILVGDATTVLDRLSQFVRRCQAKESTR